MDVSNIANTANLNGVQGRTQSNQSLSMMVSKMEIRFSDAREAGQLSGDQTSQIKEILDKIAELLKTDQTGTGNQLSSDDRGQIRNGIHDIAEMLFAALKAQDGSDSNTDKVDRLSNQMNSNGNGSVGSNQPASYWNSAEAGNTNAGNPGYAPAAYTQQGSYSMSMTMVQSTFSISA
jgi:hypothetical protein